MKLKFTIAAALLSLIVLISGCGSDSPTNNNTGSGPYIEKLTCATAVNGIVLTLTGRNFANDKSSNFVSIPGAQLTDNDYVDWTSTKVRVYIPTNAVSGAVSITVDGTKSNEVTITIKPQRDADAPLISDLDNTKGVIGGQVGIFGSNFGSSRGSSTVEFSGFPAAEYLSWSDTKIVVKIPNEAVSGPIAVFVNNKSSNPFYYPMQAQNYIVPMVKIPAGSFDMGSNSTEDGINSEIYKPVHHVTFSKDLYMAVTEITQKQWGTVFTGSNPSQEPWIGDNYPVQQVTWLRTVKFCNELSKIQKRTPCYDISDTDHVKCNWDADGYRLPTEAEWEYASRAGSMGDYGLLVNGNEAKIEEIGVTNKDGDIPIRVVKSKNPNKFGLYDMHGNVWEWCWDWYDPDYYSAKINWTDPKGPDSGIGKIRRGGCFNEGVRSATSYYRENYDNNGYNYNLGFRIVTNKAQK